MYYKFSDEITDHKSYYAGKYIAKVLSCFVYKKLTVKGTENIPMNGPIIIASNHIAFSDPAIIVSNCPRTVHFMAKSELFENPLKAAFMRCMNAFPVKRNHFDRAALRQARRILENGWALGIFPEGRRVADSQPTQAKSGIAYIARLTGADVLPACIYRAPEDSSIWHKLVLSYGTVIKNAELDLKSESLEKASDLIMERIRQLWRAENENKNS